MNKIRWGILSTARIATEKVIPAMQASPMIEVTAIASRSRLAAEEAASRLGIPRVHGSYEDLLADPQVDAVYNPLPNHLHVPWSIRALEAGKHVLCEKPIAMSAEEAETLLTAAKRHPECRIMEAFMYRHHPQWQHAKSVVAEGRLGTVRTIHSLFAYHNTNPADVRNMAAIGGGGLMDIGCYCISLARFIYNAEPSRAVALIERDPSFTTDRLTSGMLLFPAGTATFTCSTQLSPYQRVHILGDQARLEIEIPFNAPLTPCRSRLCEGDRCEQIEHPACNQYSLQAEAFSRAILENAPVPVPLEDAAANMRVIDALFASARGMTWVSLP